MNNEIIFASLVAISNRIQRREITCLEVAEALLYHIHCFNKYINCFTELKPTAAILAEASLADDALSRGESKGILHGVPVSIKDTFNVSGFKNSSGNPFLRNYRPKVDADLVARIRNAGALIIGKTNLPLLALDWVSKNPWAGQTNNPYDVTRVPGGSSGGSAAALAAGFTFAELGSDAGGSIRVPAHFCGICGLRPSEGLLSNRGQFDYPGKPQGLDYITVPGPMARSMSDLKILFNILTADTIKQNKEVEDESVALSEGQLQIAYSHTLDDTEIDNSYHDQIKHFIHKLRMRGHTVSEQKPSYNHEEVYRSWATIVGSDFGVKMPGLPFESLIMKWFLQIKYRDKLWAEGMYAGITNNKKAVEKAMQVRNDVKTAYNSFFSKVDVWLTPVSADGAFQHQRSGLPFRINSSLVPYTQALGAFNFPTAVPGHPICVIPIGTINSGMPVGIQIHSKIGSDRRLLLLAEEFEKLTEGFQAPKLNALN